MNTHHPSATAGTSQCDSILRLLSASPGAWVSMMDLHRFSGAMAVHSRISELRGRGHDIAWKKQTHGKMIHSFYRLIPRTATHQPDLF
jgi:hypothetical protein